MSWLSQATGVHISPHGVSLSKPDPIGVAKTALTNPLFDGALAIGLPGIGSAIGGALSAIPGASAVGGALGGLGSAVGGALSEIPGASSIEGLLGKAGGLLTGNGGKNALGLAQGVDSVLNQQQANNYGKDALGAVTGAYNAAAPLRAQGLQGLLNPQAPDLSNISNIAGTLKQQDPSATSAIQAQLAQLHAPTPGALSQFTAPQKPRATSLQSLMKDPGNPYARTA